MNSRKLVLVGVVLGATVPAVAQPAETTVSQPSTASTPQPVESSAMEPKAVGTITGEGAIGRIPRFTGANTIGNSMIVQRNGNIGIGTSDPMFGKLSVANPDGGTALYATTTRGVAMWVEIGPVFGGVPTNSAIVGKSNAADTYYPSYGVYGESSRDNGVGVFGKHESTTGTGPGVKGETDSKSTGAVGVLGQVLPTAPGSASAGVKGINNGTESYGSGVYGGHAGGGQGVYGSSRSGTGVYGRSSSGPGVYAYSSSGYAGYFSGKVKVTGNLEKPAGSFKIDHPLDPANKYLSHSFVESPDMMNIYNGNVKLDRKGQATVQMPAYFTALNREFRYQLTAIGAPGPNLYIAQKISHNRFKIAGGKPGTEVSWQVTGVRQDAYARDQRIKVEQDKGKERGYYLYPAGFGKPKAKSMEYAQRPVAKPGVAKQPVPARAAQRPASLKPR